MSPKTRSIAVLVGKVCLAILLLAGLFSVAGASIAPKIPLTTVLVFAGGLMLALGVLAIVSLTFSQFILRMGGTDAQWFWFSSEPKGLVQLREQAVHRKDSV
jgi:hypothetical protein